MLQRVNADAFESILGRASGGVIVCSECISSSLFCCAGSLSLLFFRFWFVSSLSFGFHRRRRHFPILHGQHEGGRSTGRCGGHHARRGRRRRPQRRGPEHALQPLQGGPSVLKPTQPTRFTTPEGEGFYAAVWRCCFSLANYMRFFMRQCGGAAFPA